MTARHVRLARAIALIVGAGFAGEAFAQAAVCGNDAPNPYAAGVSFAALPDGRHWGSTASVSIAPDNSVWAFERCGANSCAGSDLNPIVHYTTDGKLLGQFGAKMFQSPHGLTVDAKGNVWVTDGATKDGVGWQVFEFSPDGKVLMTLGTPGGTGNGPDAFNQPNAVAIAPDGSIFISQGHAAGGDKSKIMKFSADGKFIRAFAEKGSGPGETDVPHAMAFDTDGRLVVADRNHGRIAIYDQNGTYVSELKQFGRPSGVFIDKNDVMYVADSESQSADAKANGYNPGCMRGIRFGSLKDGKVLGFLPDPAPRPGTSGAEGVAVDAAGEIFGAEVGPMDVKKYVKK
jgi:sugar lactone lactonase YvrE